ncbi:MAG: glycosyltransferase family 4 protein [Planctomycetes bacterium]|nr:glycosyltransferase family 4 protein [Planctomycetota bacterium]
MANQVRGWQPGLGPDYPPLPKLADISPQITRSFFIPHLYLAATYLPGVPTGDRHGVSPKLGGLRAPCGIDAPGGQTRFVKLGHRLFEASDCLDVLVRATALVCRAQPVQLVIVGDGPYREELVAAIVANDLADSVRLLGMRGDVASWLQAADAFVFPSRTEGLPNALLEAMAVGLPVVTTDVAGCRDLIEDGRTGLLVPVDDAAALAAAMLRLLDQRPFARRLGEAAADHVRRRHRRKDCFEAYRALYRQTLTGKDPGG